MLKKISNGQLDELLTHLKGVTRILMEVCLIGDDEDAEPDLEIFSEDSFDKIEMKPEKAEPPYMETATPSYVNEYHEFDLRRKKLDLGILCGRWTTGGNRCGIEISRKGDHYVLTYLKRNGYPSDERYVLVWSDGDVFYHGYQDRITVLALDTQSDTLMISPGVDYTRVPQSVK